MRNDGIQRLGLPNYRSALPLAQSVEFDVWHYSDT
jgi:hypothetical protein